MEIIKENIKYQLDTENKTAAVIGYQVEPIDVKISEYVEYENEKYKVTEIGEEAFYLCKKIESIDIPNGVTYIGGKAFYWCDSLSSITIPDSVTFIGYLAFSYCSSLTSFTIPDSVTFIDFSAFQGCSSLKSITIPDSVTKIGTSMFSFCSSLTSITIPDSVSIGLYGFHKIGIKLPKRYTEDGKLIAYKGFNADMTCRKFQYEEGKSYEIEGEIKCCNRGFHACINLLDVFNYYKGQIGTDFVIHEVYLSGDIDDDNFDSKVCASKIEIGRRLTVKDINEIINNK